MAAGKATLQQLNMLKGEYERLDRYGDELARCFKETGDELDLQLKIAHYRSMFSVKFENNDVFAKFYRNLLSAGVLFAPSEYEVNFISFAHTQRNIEETKIAIRGAMGSL